MGEGAVHLAFEQEGVARITFEHAQARNAMTFAMYEQLYEVCERIDSTPDVRLAVLRGTGEAFIAGTEISEFLDVTSAEDGIAYEQRVETVVSRLEALTVPTLGAVDGPAVGGGLVLAAACDLRIISERARFGVPIARTVGNCLSLNNLRRLERSFGLNAVRKMLLTAVILDAREAARVGFALECVAPEDFDRACQGMIASMLQLAPLTLSVTRQGLRRLERHYGHEDHDLIAQVYGSADFQEGVRAFLDKRRPQWRGR